MNKNPMENGKWPEGTPLPWEDEPAKLKEEVLNLRNDLERTTFKLKETQRNLEDARDRCGKLSEQNWTLQQRNMDLMEVIVTHTPINGVK
jgi:hypothetical protein